MSVVRTVLCSAGHALRGLLHAFARERNVRLYSIPYLLLLLLGVRLSLTQGEWLMFLLSGGLFLSTELLNTSMERLTDVMDDHLKQTQCPSCFEAVRIAKDVAAAASLVSLLTTVAVALVVFYPHITAFWLSSFSSFYREGY